MKYLMIASSSHGHVFPAIRLAHHLQAQGHDVLFVASRPYEHVLGFYGIKCIGVNNAPHPFLSTVDWYGEQTNLDQVRVIDQVVVDYQPDRLVTSPLVMSAFIIAERHRIATIVIGYCEYLYPGLGPHGAHPGKTWRLDTITAYYNRVRQQMGLPDAPPDPEKSPLIGDRHLLRSTPEFDRYQALPEQVRYVGGLYWEPQYTNHELSEFMAASRAAGRPLWVVQIGRLFEHPEKWHRLVAALKDLPADFVVDIGRADYLSEDFEAPANFSLHPFVPVGALRDHVQGIICSGQTTSVISAIHHAKPILSLPHSDDARELTQRVEANGVGMGVYQNDDIYAAYITRCLKHLQEGSFQANLQTHQQQFTAREDQLQPALFQLAVTS